MKNSEEQYRSLVNNLNAGVFRFVPTSSGQWKWVNPAFLAIFGYPSIDEMGSIRVIDLFQSEDDYHDLEKIFRRQKLSEILN
ncbi:PAS domain-containing protein [Methanospirillum hungatei]|uniref:PAS domain-containing protein n=1 Tax=Methanospirillum hungatei TaxID=2203 RepID=UPI002A1B3091|nr:PAS domain-containing protein [Methanospirillum hungatei]